MRACKGPLIPRRRCALHRPATTPLGCCEGLQCAGHTRRAGLLKLIDDVVFLFVCAIWHGTVMMDRGVTGAVSRRRRPVCATRLTHRRWPPREAQCARAC